MLDYILQQTTSMKCMSAFSNHAVNVGMDSVHANRTLGSVARHLFKTILNIERYSLFCYKKVFQFFIVNV